MAVLQEESGVLLGSLNYSPEVPVFCLFVFSYSGENPNPILSNLFTVLLSYHN